MEHPADPLRRQVAAVASFARAGRAVGDALADAAPLPIDGVARIARALAFWTAVALPLVHLPLLLVAGLSSETTSPLVTLWALHGIVLVVGADHDPDL